MGYSEDKATPVDLNKPITNDGLKKAIEANNNSEESLSKIVDELKKSNLMIPILSDEMKTTPSGEKGKVTIQKESKIKILYQTSLEGKPIFTVFTDWDEIRAWTKQPVNTIVIKLSDVIFMGLEQNYQGTIINPSGKSLYLDQATLKKIKSQIDKP